MKKLLVILMLLLITVTIWAPIDKQDPRQAVERFLSGAGLTSTNLKLAFEFNRIVSPAIVMAQSRLETGNYMSNLCLSANNLFGMNYPKCRPTTANGANEYGFAVYKSWYDSVKDMKLFQDYYKKQGKDLSNYFEFLSTIGYAEDPEYLNKLTLLCMI